MNKDNNNSVMLPMEVGATAEGTDEVEVRTDEQRTRRSVKYSNLKEVK